MSRNKPKRLLHPARMAEAMEALNETILLYVAKVNTAASLIARATDTETTKRLAADLGAASDDFTAAIWPQEE